MHLYSAWTLHRPHAAGRGMLEHGTVSHACAQAWLPTWKVVEDYFENWTKQKGRLNVSHVFMLLQQRIKNIIRVASYVCLILTWRCLCQRQTYLSNNRRPKLFPQLIDPEFFLLVHYFTFVILEAGVHGSSSKHWKTAWKLVVVLPFYIWFSRFSSKAFQTQHRLKSCLSRFWLRWQI